MNRVALNAFYALPTTFPELVFCSILHILAFIHLKCLKKSQKCRNVNSQSVNRKRLLLRCVWLLDQSASRKKSCAQISEWAFKIQLEVSWTQAKISGRKLCQVLHEEASQPGLASLVTTLYGMWGFVRVKCWLLRSKLRQFYALLMQFRHILFTHWCKKSQ